MLSFQVVLRILLRGAVRDRVPPTPAIEVPKQIPEVTDNPTQIDPAANGDAAVRVRRLIRIKRGLPQVLNSTTSLLRNQVFCCLLSEDFTYVPEIDKRAQTWIKYTMFLILSLQRRPSRVGHRVKPGCNKESYQQSVLSKEIIRISQGRARGRRCLFIFFRVRNSRSKTRPQRRSTP